MKQVLMVSFAALLGIVFTAACGEKKPAENPAGASTGGAPAASPDGEASAAPASS